jgi:hypothetical protein
MRWSSLIRFLAALGLVGAAALTQQFPLKQATEKLVAGPMRVDKVKEGLYVIRGLSSPALPVAAGLMDPTTASFMNQATSLSESRRKA